MYLRTELTQECRVTQQAGSSESASHPRVKPLLVLPGLVSSCLRLPLKRRTASRTTSSPQQEHHAVASGKPVFFLFTASAPSAACTLSIIIIYFQVLLLPPSGSPSKRCPPFTEQRHQRQEQARQQNQRTASIRPPRIPIQHPGCCLASIHSKLCISCLSRRLLA